MKVVGFLALIGFLAACGTNNDYATYEIKSGLSVDELSEGIDAQVPMGTEGVCPNGYQVISVQPDGEGSVAQISC